MYDRSLERIFRTKRHGMRDDMQDFPNEMLREIYEQPAALRRTLARS
jgi:glucosamine 6-phosphate synthetase-like amidotransferase/phosphosugar isomerase protein